MNLRRYIDRQIYFSMKAFGPGRRTKGVIAHIKKELVEIKAKPNDLSEWIDVVILALDGAWRHGGTSESICKALADKLKKNEARKWPDWRQTTEDHPIEHER